MGTPATKRSEAETWLIELIPGLETSFDAIQNGNSLADSPPLPINGEAESDPASSLILEQNSAAPGGPAGAKGGYELDVISKTIKKQVKYGTIELTTSIKINPQVGGAAGSPVGSSTSYTNKSKDGQRQGGVKQRFSYQDIGNLELLKDLQIKDISLGAQGEWSGMEVSATLGGECTIQTPNFNTKVKINVILFKIKENESPKIGGIEIKVEPAKFTVKVAGIETSLTAEFKFSFVVDTKEVALRVIEDAAKKRLEKEAVKQGVKLLGREAAEKLLARLGPLATAFEVGWIIGSLLSKYTIANDVAVAVDEKILGDLNERYQKASTLGKIGLVARNLDRITAALIASGVSGAVAGMGDLIAFKLLHLDRLADYAQSLKQFYVLRDLIPNIGEAAGDAILSTVIKLGIKFNPKYGRIANPSLAAIGAAIFTEIHPVFKKKGGLQTLVNMHMQDVDVPASELSKAAQFILQSKLNYGGKLDLKSSPEQVVNDLLDFHLQEFLGFLETNKLISYTVNLGNEIGLDSVDQNLVDEVFL
jgi:hypothetical protein